MTAHTCKSLTYGCYRCELGVDEMRGALADMRAAAIGILAAIEVLRDHERDLRRDIANLSREIDRWDMCRPTTPTTETRESAGESES